MKLLFLLRFTNLKDGHVTRFTVERHDQRQKCGWRKASCYIIKTLTPHAELVLPTGEVRIHRNDPASGCCWHRRCFLDCLHPVLHCADLLGAVTRRLFQLLPLSTFSTRNTTVNITLNTFFFSSRFGFGRSFHKLVNPILKNSSGLIRRPACALSGLQK